MSVHTPDLVDGRTFDDVASGVGYAREVGFAEVRGRGSGADGVLRPVHRVRRALADPGSSSYDAEAAALLVERVLGFLDSVG